MGMKQVSFVDVLTINAKDPTKYQPPFGSGQTAAVLIGIEPEEVVGSFAEHIGEYAEWSGNSWILRTKAQLFGCTIYAHDTKTFHLHDGEDCTLPISTGAVDEPIADDEDGELTRGGDVVVEEPTEKEIEAEGGDREKARAKKEKAAKEKAAKDKAAAKKVSKRKAEEKKAAEKAAEKRKAKEHGSKSFGHR